MVEISGVKAGSPAKKAGIRPKDMLVSVNGHEIHDVLDYGFHAYDGELEIRVERDGREKTFSLKKAENADTGLVFDKPLMDDKKHCLNKCIFCFIDQLPKGMRETLYFKDDDSRLSFLHGNYITMTNLTESDVDRIISMRLSPLRVSVHTTNPELRVKMMRNKNAGKTLGYLRRVADAGIAVDAQIVLCRGINDGAELDRTMRDLLEYVPALESVSVVPAGLTKYREGLYPLSPYAKDECAAVIKQVNAVGDECLKKYGGRIFFCADEFYVKAGIKTPESGYYEGFPQLWDGVGLIALFEEEFRRALNEPYRGRKKKRKVTVVTGIAARDLISGLAGEICEKAPWMSVNVIAVENDFFGHEVTVAGLLTAGDIAEQVRKRFTREETGDELLFPAAALRDGEDVFLDDKTPKWLEKKLGVKVRDAGRSGEDFFRAVTGLPRKRKK